MPNLFFYQLHRFILDHTLKLFLYLPQRPQIYFLDHNQIIIFAFHIFLQPRLTKTSSPLIFLIFLSFFSNLSLIMFIFNFLSLCCSPCLMFPLLSAPQLHNFFRFIFLQFLSLSNILPLLPTLKPLATE